MMTASLPHERSRQRACNRTEQRNPFVKKTARPSGAAVHSVREGLVVINAISADLQGQFEPEHLAVKVCNCCGM